MAVYVSFDKPSFIGDRANLAIGYPSAYEAITVGNTSTAAAQDGEWAYVFSDEATAVRVAIGFIPNASATTSTRQTSAAFILASEQPVPIDMKAGYKIAVAALS